MLPCRIPDLSPVTRAAHAEYCWPTSSLPADDRLTQNVIDAWVADLHETGQKGQCFFSVNRFIFDARKSESPTPFQHSQPCPECRLLEVERTKSGPKQTSPHKGRIGALPPNGLRGSHCVISSLRDIAAALNARGVKAARGGEWYAATVGRVIERASV